MVADPIDSAPPDLAGWSLHCFCIEARVNPKRVIDLDNNGVLLLRCVDGATLTQLKHQGLIVAESQIALLEAHGLIAVEGDRIQTRFPVLFPSSVRELRQWARHAVEPAIGEIQERTWAIRELLAGRNLSSNAHAVVFGHGLDGVYWDILRSRDLAPATSLTVEEPFWRGSFWASYPGRNYSAGTNERREDGAVLVMVWDDRVADRLRALQDDPEVGRMLREVDASARTVAMAMASDREIPVIRVDSGDPLHRACHGLAEVIATLIPDGPGCQGVLSNLGVETSPHDAAVIISHELIWEAAGVLESSDLRPSPDAIDRLFVRLG